MEKIPILRMGEYLLVTIQVDMHDRLALTLQDDLTNRISQTGAKAVLIDISSLEIVDSFIGRMLGNIAAMGSRELAISRFSQAFQKAGVSYVALTSESVPTR